MPGYKDPPKETQFKKGVSGNPKGRPKGSRNTLKILEEVLEQKIQILQDGKQIFISKKNAMLLQLVNSAVKGNLKAISALMPFMLNLDEQTAKEEEELSLEDKEILEMFLNEYNKGEKQ